MTVKTFITDILYKYALDMSFIKERKDFHPEASLLQHTLTVMDNSRNYNKPELLIAALFHDIGKVYTYNEYQNSYGHEDTSAWILQEHFDDIVKLGLDFEFIWWIVKNHIKAARLIEGFTINKKDYLLTGNKWWKDLVLFSKLDDMLNDKHKDLRSLLDKKVYVTLNNRDVVAGRCDMLGFNSALNVKQVVIDRCIHRVNNYNQVCTYFNPQIMNYEL